MTIAEFIEKNAITITIVPVPLHETDAPKSFRYKVKIHYAGKDVTTNYFCGSAHVGRFIPSRESAHGTVISGYWKHATQNELKDYENKIFKGFIKPIPPQIESVMECLFSDYCLLNAAPFWPEYASELELSVDSIKERNIYDYCVNQFMAFRKMLGYAKTQEFLACDRE